GRGVFHAGEERADAVHSAGDGLVDFQVRNGFRPLGVEPEAVVARAAGEAVGDAAADRDQDVVPVAAVERAGAGPAAEEVVFPAADEGVVAVAAVEERAGCDWPGYR